MSIYDTLNDRQQEAVFHTEGPLLILAGAGSGKTRVLTHRIAWLIDQIGVNPWNILAITFTNKAAGEMRERVDQIVGFGSESIWVSTFHSMCVRILRRYIDRLGYDTNFTIYDADDQKTLIKDVCKYLQIDTKMFKERSLLSAISSAKDELVTPEEMTLRAEGDWAKKKIAQVYTEYEKQLKANNALDFDDLLLKTVQLLQTQPDVLEYYQERFRYIMVDEYQDTNTVQFKLVSLLAGKYQNLCVVGDDDQSIYKFRGANIMNILNFEKEYPNAKVIKLEQNYRSTSTILNAANEVIRHNTGRKEKSLWTENGEGEKIQFRQFDSAYDEADYIVSDIKDKVNSGKREYKDFAILYRTNMESRSMIDVLTKRKIPFVLLDKGYNFFNHFICRDLINYLKLSIDQYDKNAFAWIINKPFRYMSKENLSYINNYKEDKSPFDILINKKDMPPFQCKKIDDLRKEILYLNKMSLGSAIQYIISTMGYIDYLREYANKYGQSLDDLEDVLEEFKGAAEGFKTITEFLVHVNNVEEQIESSKVVEDGVILSTIHGVKGMEFNNVYIINCNEEVIPHKSSMEENIEEERRLFYVGITRAINNLYVFSPKTMRGKFREASRFIAESHLEEESEKVDYGIEVGNMLYHRTYGEGSVIEIDKDKITIKFKDICRSFSLKVLMENNLVILIN